MLFLALKRLRDQPENSVVESISILKRNIRHWTFHSESKIWFFSFHQQTDFEDISVSLSLQLLLKQVSKTLKVKII
jgi:hypothetical protein